jgi:hypothetical protein
MIVSLFIGSASYDNIATWVFYLLIDTNLIVQNGVVPKDYDKFDLDFYAISKGVEYLKLNYSELINNEQKIRIHTSYEGEISLPNYEKCNNVHYLQTNADIDAMELAKRIKTR